MINILVVDDSAANGSMIQSALETVWIQVHTLTLPERAAEICTQLDIDIALIDVNMPKINGYELLEQLKKAKQTEHIMVILITGQAMDQEDVLKGLSSGAMDYLFKPLDLYIMAAKIDALITIIAKQREIHEQNRQLEQYQDQLIQAVEHAEQSKAAKENFLANMSHEIRTPLNAIIGLTHILKTVGPGPEKDKIVDLLEYSGNSLIGIVNDVLELSKMDAGELKINQVKTDLGAMIDHLCSATRTLAAGKNLELHCTLAPGVPEVIIADNLRLNQILINLINNAIKFTAEGAVSLTITVVERQGDSFLLDFEVKDTGIGIPEQRLGQIFNRYEQLEHQLEDKLGSSGLGLSIVKKLVELKGGELMVSSIVGMGSTFTYRNWYPAASIQPEGAEPQPKKYQNISCLVVDDNEINRFITSKLLSDWDIDVNTANDGKEAVDLVQHNNYDLILMDLYMPVMNGFDATKTIRQLDNPQSTIPILGFSATIQQQDRELGFESGINGFLQKPFKPLVLNHKIDELLKKR